MARIYAENSLTVYLYRPPREHPPPHVHVESTNGGEVLIKLGTTTEAPSIWSVHGMRKAEVARALRMVEARQEKFLAEWRYRHGS
jgi:hypothetical protein